MMIILNRWSDRLGVCRVCLSVVILACFAASSIAEEPGTVVRNGVSVYKAPAPEQSDYFVAGTENLYPPLRPSGVEVVGMTGVGIRLIGEDVWSDLLGYEQNPPSGVYPYDSFLSNMGFSINDLSLEWPLDSATSEPVQFLGSTTISELLGAYLSRASFSTFGDHGDYTFNPGSTAGFNHKGYPRVGVPEDTLVPPSYPPITQDIGLSNSPLVPATIAGTPRAIYSTRETIDGQLDLITGQPLIREVDLEIPFGGAVFRRIRTYSEIPSTGVQAHNWHDGGSWERSRTAGWHGSGWMSNDAPLFLIDAGFAQTVSIPQGEQVSAPRCIFALDAHRAIPFTRQVSSTVVQSGNAGNYNVDYIAPEWFDGILLHFGGIWDGTAKRWSVYPNEFRVILNKRSVTYIIKPYYEDVDPANHKQPAVDNQIFDTTADARFGVPYYGLVTEIKDRSGNRIEYTYAEGHQPFDGPLYELRTYDQQDPGSYTVEDAYRSVRQHGWYKGMIDHIKLYPAGETEAAWTLLYTYRAFAAQREALKDWNFWDYRSFPPALHSVLAYEEDLDVESIARDLILKCHDEPDLTNCGAEPEPTVDGWYADASDLDVNPGGHSSVEIDSVLGGRSTRVSGIESEPFCTLRIEDEDHCENWMTPVPIKASYANPFDYQDMEIGPGGEGDDLASWTVLPKNWLKQVRYAYADPPQYTTHDGPNNEGTYDVCDDYTSRSAGPVEIPEEHSAQARMYSFFEGQRVAYLIKARAINRDDREQEGEVVSPENWGGTERYWLYRYQDTVGAGGTTPERFESAGAWYTWDGWQSSEYNAEPTRRLSYRYSPRSVDTIAPSTVWVQSHGSKNQYVNYIIGLDDDAPVPTMSGESQFLYEAADAAYLRWSEPYRFKGIQENGSTSSATFDGVAYPGSWAAFDGDLEGTSGRPPSAFQTDLRTDYLGSVDSDVCADLKISQADPARTGFLPEGTSIYAARDGQGNKRWFRLYRFISTPMPDEHGGTEPEVAWRGVDSQSQAVGGHDPSIHTAYFRGPELVLPTSVYPGATQALYHFPFRFAIADVDAYDDGATGYGQHQRKNPMWWVVVDEYASLDEALSVNSSLTHDEGWNDGWAHDFFTGEDPWMTRRVVAINSAGLALSDRTWDSDRGVNAPPSILEAYTYDDYMRLEMKFSRGWGSELVTGRDEEDENGLVEVFTYDDPVVIEDPDGSPGNGDEVLHAPREIKGVWLNKGCSRPEGTADVHVSELVYYRDVFPDAPDYIAGQIYSQIVYDLEGNADLATIDHRVEYWSETELTDPDQDFDAENPPIKWEINVGAQFRRDPTKPFVRPVDISFFNQQGQLVWKISGSMEGILGSSPSAMNSDVNFSVGDNDELFIDYCQYDEEGREYFAVQDIDIPEVLNGSMQSSGAFDENDIKFPSGEQQQWPIEESSPHGVLFLGGRSDVQEDDIADNLGMEEFWEQLDSDISLLLNGMFRRAQAPPLDLVTYREFNRFGPKKVVYPTGARDLYDYRLESSYLNELKAMGVEFDGESWGFSGQQLFDSKFDGQQFTSQIQSVMDDLLANQWDGDPYSLSGDIFVEHQIQVIADVTPNYDSSGRLSSMAVSDPESDAQPIEQSVAYDGWGNIVRKQDADGTIERVTYDKFGRMHKSFKGSKDRHEIWGTADIGQDDDDMFLVEKVHYGLGTNDAGLVSQKWMFREKSGTQYGIDWDDPSEGAQPASYFVAGNSLSGETSSGILETYEYDWRMRKVITKYHGLDGDQQNTAVIREERVFLDNADRARFVAVYSGVANANAPDPDLAPGDTPTEAADFFANNSASNLLSLQETVYNGAGQTVEIRRYDPDTSTPAQPGYLATQSYTDHANRPTWTRDSGQRITKSVYDAKGRVAWTSTFAGEFELERTVNMYGAADTVDVMIVFERIDTSGVSTESLDQVDKRVTLIHQWFDSNKRLLARADFGEAVYTGSIAAYPTPYRPGEAPIILVDMEQPPIDQGNPPEILQEPARQLVGLDYPAEWIDPITGRGLARVDAYWYGAQGKKNATLKLLSVEPQDANHFQMVYTIDRIEHNNYGQKVLEHRYGFDLSVLTDPGSNPGLPALTPESISASAEFLGGMSYSYEVEGWDDPQDPTPPPLFAGTKVREIIPLTEGHLISYSPELRRNSVDWANSTDPVRKTVLEYNAPIVEPDYQLPGFIVNPNPAFPYTFPIDSDDWGHLGVSNRPDLVKAVHLPGPIYGNTGSGTGYSLFYFYYADGLPAYRLDSRGIAIRYIYDERGNLVRLESDDSNMPLVDSLGLSDEQLPANAIEYEYDAIDRLVLATTKRDYANDLESRVDTESVFEFDGLGNMIKEYQARGDDVDTATTPHVGYEWERVYAQFDYSSGNLATRDNIDRIASITYPQRPWDQSDQNASAWTATHDGGAVTPRKIKYEYGADGTVSDLLSRVERVSSEGGPAGLPIIEIAKYQYSGVNRLEAALLGEPSGSTPGSGDSILRDVRSFDAFGRVSSRSVTGWDGASGYENRMVSEFGYDIAGRRIFERLTQQDVDASTSRDNTHSAYYAYDTQGRLIGEHYGTFSADGFDGIDHNASVNSPLAMSYTLDLLNRRVGVSAYNEQTAEWEVQVPGVQIWEDTNKDAVIDAGEILEQTHEIDQRGGLTGLNDGAAVEAVGQDVAGAITNLHGREVYYDWLGRPVLIHDSNTGKPVASMTYDAFGRLATRKALWPGQSKSTVYRNETYYYDGVRRIQEVFTDPVDATPPWPVAPGDEPLNSDGGVARMEAEYIWSAASGQPFDTCHVQIDWWDREAWFIQDHQTGTVRGFVDANGELVEQYRFDAFGTLRGVDSFALSSSGQLFEGFRQRLGHQGLFAERVDGTTLDPVLVSAGEQWYQSRSRWYVPELGRFLTSDPNATGIPTQNSLAMLGRMPAGPPSGSFGWEAHYGDGWDTYTAYGANPIMNQDPSGLFFLGFIGGGGVGMDIYADYGDEVMGAGADAMGYVNSSISDAAYAQADMVDTIMDWGTPSSALAGMNSAGMAFSSDSSRRRTVIRWHHIASNKHKSKWTPKFQAMFNEVGLSMNSPHNKVPVPAEFHRGRHPNEYHRLVYENLEDVIKRANALSMSQAEKRLLFIEELQRIGKRINMNPGILHNRIRGVWTGYANKRRGLL